MAKRRKLEAPNPDDLARIEDEFRRETLARPQAAPISQVAAESAQAGNLENASVRASRARDASEAAAHREAVADGRIVLNIALDQIDPDAMVRDRTILDPDEMEELKASIAATGLRMPIEVFAHASGREGPPYGLLSGYRRLRAVQALVVEGRGVAMIKAIIREPEAMGGAFAAMVEENEIRANLSHFERGRIAVIAAQQGAFESVEGAVNGLFPVASKAKRSKIRSFSVIFEELGDLLTRPEALKEREGLRIAAVLRQGGEGELRSALGTGQGVDEAAEWALIEPILLRYEASAEKAPTKGGRPKTKPVVQEWSDEHTLVLSSGITLRRGSDPQGHTIRLEGEGIDSELMNSVMAKLQSLLEKS